MLLLYTYVYITIMLLYILQKLYVLLLHFPAMMFYDPCYPSLFLYGWDHYYLDAIDQTNESVLVDTRYVYSYFHFVFVDECMQLL